MRTSPGVLAGRLILTAPAETHIEVANKMQEWTKR